MGYARWDTSDSSNLYATKVSTRSVQSSQEIFASRSMDPNMDPRQIIVRESRDSDMNPLSTPIIIGLDVTGSMGIIAEKFARGKLGELMNGIFDRKPVTDPHIMVMGVGDINCDSAPLQVSQFEADIAIDNSLQAIFLEGGGGGNQYESYDLAWSFAANKTSIDSFEKRGKKGYIFTIGDELPPPPSGYSQHQMERVFGKTEVRIQSDPRRGLEAAQEKYDVFHIIVEQGSYCRQRGTEKVLGAWSELLGKRALPLNNWEYIAELILAAIEINEGNDPEEVIMSREVPEIRDVLRHAFGV